MMNEKGLKKASKVILGTGIGVPFIIFLFTTFQTQSTAKAEQKAMQAVDSGIVKVLEANNQAVIRELKTIQTNQVNLNRRIDNMIRSR